MKKIMFNDRYGLTKAVLEGRKTMTRRIIPQGLRNQTDWKAVEYGEYEAVVDGEGYYHDIRRLGQFQAGDVVAVAQAYKDINLLFMPHQDAPDFKKLSRPGRQWGFTKSMAGWANKMFVAAEFMPHHIRIEDLRVERLQDITEEDAMCEGIFKYDQPPLHHESDMYSPWPPHVRPYKFDHDNHRYFCNARAAFAYLIDKVSGRGTWKSNPYVFVYSFRLINQS